MFTDILQSRRKRILFARRLFINAINNNNIKNIDPPVLSKPRKKLVDFNLVYYYSYY